MGVRSKVIGYEHYRNFDSSRLVNVNRVVCIVLQFEVDDLPAFIESFKERGGTVIFGPSFDKDDGFWYGAIADLEGNQIWLVDKNCP